MAVTRTFDIWAGRAIGHTRSLRDIAMRIRNGDQINSMRGGLTILTDYLAQMCREIEMDHMARQFKSFRLELLSGKFLENDRFADRAEVLIKTFEIELMELWFHRVSANKKPFYGADFGEQVKKSFPSAKSDIFEANTCFALERYNASIYHCMMVLERGLPGPSKAFKDNNSTQGQGYLGRDDWRYPKEDWRAADRSTSATAG